jgi:hypothetical protein
MQVPDRAAETGACCSKCSNFFTPVPVRETKPTAPPGWLQAARAASGSKASSAVRLATAPLARPSVGPLQLRPRPRWLDPVGLAAILGAGVALVCASFSSLVGLVPPVSAVSLLLGLVDLPLVVLRGQHRLVCAAVGTVLGGVVLLLAMWFPGALGPVYQAARAPLVEDPMAIRVVPLAGSPGSMLPTTSQWVDAKRSALRQGMLQVQVLSAAVRSSKPTTAKKVAPKAALYISFRSQQPEVASDFAAKQSPGPSPRFDAASPRLTDKNGKTYALQEVQEMAAGKSERKSRTFPAAIQEHVFIFEAPSPGQEYLHLQVPAAAWGGVGDFCFEIPGMMISYPQAGAGGLAGGR